MKLIGFGCDGTSVNIAERGLIMYLQDVAPWIEVFWCLAYRLELALKDALKSMLFKSVDKMLLQVYYLYEKSPKCAESLRLLLWNLSSALLQESFLNMEETNLFVNSTIAHLFVLVVHGL